MLEGESALFFYLGDRFHSKKETFSSRNTNFFTLPQEMMLSIQNEGDAAKENGRIVFSVKKTGTDVSFLVADNGKGIRKEDICKLFQPFYTSGKIKGTGLGLSVVHDIIEAHNGSIRVRSILGLYTCFLIRIPKDG